MGKIREIERITKFTVVVLLVLYIVSPLSVTAGSCIADTRTGLADIKVAVYEGTSLSSVIASRDALVKMYEWMGAEVEVINTTQIIDGDLSDYEILAFPGGNPVSYKSDLGLEGRRIVHDWVEYGGSYLGICGGGMFACVETSFGDSSVDYGLDIFDGSCRGPIGTLGGVVDVHVNTSCSGPDLSGISETMASLYLGGGYYTANDGQEMFPVVTYDYNSKPGTIVAPSGNGTVCLSAIHVEFEEDSDRDGTDYYDETYEDPDSEWDLMLQISIWQIESSTWVTPPVTTTTTTTTSTTNTTSGDSDGFDPIPVSVIAAVSIGVIVIVAVLVKKR